MEEILQNGRDIAKWQRYCKMAEILQNGRDIAKWKRYCKMAEILQNGRDIDDNGRCHVSRATMQWYADNNVRRLDRPAQSPGTNPIEHLWDELDRRVRARQARPKSIAQLVEWLQEEWRRIPVDVLQTLAESMQSRVAAVGGATVAERLACSPPTKAIRVQSPAGSLQIFACENRATRCRWSAGFLGDISFPPPFHYGAAPQSPSPALKKLFERHKTTLQICVFKEQGATSLASDWSTSKRRSLEPQALATASMLSGFMRVTRAVLRSLPFCNMGPLSGFSGKETCPTSTREPVIVRCFRGPLSGFSGKEICPTSTREPGIVSSTLHNNFLHTQTQQKGSRGALFQGSTVWILGQGDLPHLHSGTRPREADYKGGTRGEPCFYQKSDWTMVPRAPRICTNNDHLSFRFAPSLLNEIKEGKKFKLCFSQQPPALLLLSYWLSTYLEPLGCLSASISNPALPPEAEVLSLGTPSQAACKINCDATGEKRTYMSTPVACRSDEPFGAEYTVISRASFANNIHAIVTEWPSIQKRNDLSARLKWTCHRCGTMERDSAPIGYCLLQKWSHGVVLDIALASHSGVPGFDPRRVHSRIVACGNRAGLCCLAAAFLEHFLYDVNIPNFFPSIVTNLTVRMSLRAPVKIYDVNIRNFFPSIVTNLTVRMSLTAPVKLASRRHPRLSVVVGKGRGLQTGIHGDPARPGATTVGLATSPCPSALPEFSPRPARVIDRCAGRRQSNERCQSNRAVPNALSSAHIYDRLVPRGQADTVQGRARERERERERERGQLYMSTAKELDGRKRKYRSRRVINKQLWRGGDVYSVSESISHRRAFSLGANGHPLPSPPWAEIAVWFDTLWAALNQSEASNDKIVQSRTSCLVKTHCGSSVLQKPHRPMRYPSHHDNSVADLVNISVLKECPPPHALSLSLSLTHFAAEIMLKRCKRLNRRNFHINVATCLYRHAPPRVIRERREYSGCVGGGGGDRSLAGTTVDSATIVNKECELHADDLTWRCASYREPMNKISNQALVPRLLIPQPTSTRQNDSDGRTCIRVKNSVLGARPRIAPVREFGFPLATPIGANRTRFPAGFSQLGIVSGDIADRRVFSGISRSPLLFRSAAAPCSLQSPSSALKTSMLRAAKISQLNPTDVNNFFSSRILLSTSARLHYRGSKLDPRLDLRSTQKIVAPSEFRAGLEIEMKFNSNRRNWWFEISIRDQQPSIVKFRRCNTFTLDPGSELGSFDLGSGKMLVQPGITIVLNSTPPPEALPEDYETRTTYRGFRLRRSTSPPSRELLRDFDCERHGAASEYTGGMNGRSPIKPADQRDRSTRFPLAKNPGVNRPEIETEPNSLNGGGGVLPRVKRSTPDQFHFQKFQGQQPDIHLLENRIHIVHRALRIQTNCREQKTARQLKTLRLEAANHSHASRAANAEEMSRGRSARWNEVVDWKGEGTSAVTEPTPPPTWGEAPPLSALVAKTTPYPLPPSPPQGRNIRRDNVKARRSDGLPTTPSQIASSSALFNHSLLKAVHDQYNLKIRNRKSRVRRETLRRPYPKDVAKGHNTAQNSSNSKTLYLKNFLNANFKEIIRGRFHQILIFEIKLSLIGNGVTWRMLCAFKLPFRDDSATRRRLRETPELLVFRVGQSTNQEGRVVSMLAVNSHVVFFLRSTINVFYTESTMDMENSVKAESNVSRSRQLDARQAELQRQDELNFKQAYLCNMLVIGTYIISQALNASQLCAPIACSSVGKGVALQLYLRQPTEKPRRLECIQYSVSLLISHQGDPGSIPCRVACGNRAGRCRWSAGFLWHLPFPPPLHSGAAPFSPHFTIVSSKDLAVKSHPYLRDTPHLNAYKENQYKNLDAGSRPARPKEGKRTPSVGSDPLGNLARDQDSREWKYTDLAMEYGTGEFKGRESILKDDIYEGYKAAPRNHDIFHCNFFNSCNIRDSQFLAGANKFIHLVGEYSNSVRQRRGVSIHNIQEEGAMQRSRCVEVEMKFEVVAVVEVELDLEVEYVVEIEVEMEFDVEIKVSLEVEVKVNVVDIAAEVGVVVGIVVEIYEKTMPLVGEFSRESPVSPASHSSAATYSARFTFIGSQDLDVQSRPRSLHSSLTATRIKSAPSGMQYPTWRKCGSSGWEASSLTTKPSRTPMRAMSFRPYRTCASRPQTRKINTPDGRSLNTLNLHGVVPLDDMRRVIPGPGQSCPRITPVLCTVAAREVRRDEARLACVPHVFQPPAASLGTVYVLQPFQITCITHPLPLRERAMSLMCLCCLEPHSRAFVSPINMVEYTFVYGTAGGNGRAARRLYQERYREGATPSHTLFATVTKRLREQGTFTADRNDCGAPKRRRTPELEEAVLLHHVEQSPSASPAEFAPSVYFCTWFMHHCTDKPVHTSHVSPNNTHIQGFQHSISINVWTGILDGRVQNILCEMMVARKRYISGHGFLFKRSSTESSLRVLGV
ncbi:hypothetical protein PR048_032181 [Dryococelus australis]|uniref:Uncharacterized protein n=1 Tax=Dryococelus australis TaxID=614101 RepID=A0ABQ9G4Q3_9NEOP|nr:hypothetical protein PR048_032181 [Dryococelus australis]